MAESRSRKQSRRGFSALLVVVVLLVVVAAGGGTLWSFGLLRLPGARGDGPDRSGKVAVPVAGRAIPAYASVRRDDLVQRETMEIAVVWLAPERAEEAGLIRDASQILGRVLAHDKDPAYAFTESDFLPKGTRAGPTAGIEPGMRGIRVPVDRVHGMHGLRRGDRFDLIAAQAIDSDPIKGLRGATVHPRLLESSAENRAWDASARVLVKNGKVVEPVRARVEAGSARKQIEEVLIAVQEDEVEALTQALALGAAIHCLPRSGLPGAGESDVPDAAPRQRASVIEVLSGPRRSTTLVPDDGPPSQAMEKEGGTKAEGDAPEGGEGAPR
jgi:Flp pilus assembly protein CpaB